MFKNKALNNFYNWYLVIITTLATLPILAPILLKFGLVWPAKMIYFVYSFFCHQFATRSIHIYDFQYAWCSRDTGIWMAVALTAWAIKYKKLKPIKWYWVIPFVVPIALDGGIQTIFTMLNFTNAAGLGEVPLYASNNFVRFLTGAFFGIGLSLWVSGTFAEELLQIEDKKASKKTFLNNIFNTQPKRIAGLMGILIMIYLFLVGLWQITGINSLPTDIADSVVKLQDANFFERRADGVCKTESPEDIFNFDCFFK